MSLGPKSGDARSAIENTLPATRRSELLRIIKQRGQVTVSELSELFEVSVDTIRRDLDVLAQRGLITREHGGAVPIDTPVNQDAPFSQRMNTRHEAKYAIARAAARLISDGETLIVNGGSTAVAFAGALGGLNGLTIVTNNLYLPSVLPTRAMRDIYVLGGQLRMESQVTLGPIGFVGTGNISGDTAVIGVGGISPTGVSTTSLAEANMIAMMMAACRRTIVIADASKFGHNSFAHIVSLDRIHTLVTNIVPPAALADALDLAGVDVISTAADERAPGSARD